ncbi:MAG: GGDEF domain-containing protein [bacterium]|nr:MAG: GGDEF domain-containing protein [bacterium]
MNPQSELELIRRILERVNSPMTSEEVLSFALQGLHDLFGCLATAIVLVDGKTENFKVAMAKGWSNEFIKRFHARPFGGLLREMVDRREPLIIVDGDSRAGTENYTFEHNYASLLAVPMGIRGKVVGFMYMSSADPAAFDQERVRAIVDMASLCTLVLDHGSLGDKVLSMSNIDPLTGLYSYKFWHEELNREIVRAEKLQSQVALMDIRLNKFKEFNAMHGHVKGDELLVEVSEIIRNQLCNLDVPCRVGSKWHVLLVGEDEEAARDIAEKILKSMERRPSIGEPVLSLSIGLSTYEQGEGEKVLINRVEDALREARRKGGNSLHVR